MADKYIDTNVYEDEDYIIELGDGTGKFEKNSIIAPPDNFEFIVIQNNNLLGVFNTMPRRLNSSEIPGLKTSLFGSDVDAHIYISKMFDDFSYLIYDCNLELSNGDILEYTINLDNINIVFEHPEACLFQLLDNPDRDLDDPVLFVRENIKGLIKLIIEKMLSETLADQSFYSDGKIVAETLDTDYLDYIADIEYEIEEFFTNFGIKIEIDIPEITCNYYNG